MKQKFTGSINTTQVQYTEQNLCKITKYDRTGSKLHLVSGLLPIAAGKNLAAIPAVIQSAFSH